MVTWRAFYSIQSGRYYAACIIICLISVACALKQNKSRIILYTFLACALGYNFVETFNGFRNDYIEDIQDCIEKESKKHTKVFINDKDYDRLKYNNDNTVITIDKPNSKMLSYICNQYNFWLHDAILIYPEKKQESVNIPSANEKCGLEYIKTLQFYSNKEKSKIYSVYSIKKNDPYIKRKEELSKNKTMEEILNKGVLQAYSVEYDIGVFQMDNTLFWIVNNDFEPETEFFYHLFVAPKDNINLTTNELTYIYKGFILGNAKKEMFHTYKVVSRELPSDCRIAIIKAGINNPKTKKRYWEKTFHPYQF